MRALDRAPDNTGRAAPRWPGYAAASAAFAFAAVSFYWGLGGTAGVSSLGGSIEQRALAHDPLIIALAWITGGLKIAGGLLALALVQPWGRRLPRRLLLVTTWSGAVLLSVYGALQLTGVALIKLGVVTPTAPVDPTVLLWRLLLWEPWFLVWGLLLGMTAWCARQCRTNGLP